MGVSIRRVDGLGAAYVGDIATTLRARLHGDLLTPGMPGYDAARTVWNAMIDRKPGLIVRCASASDVREAVHFARENNLLVAVRGGGHNIAGNAVCEDGLMIDLSPMQRIQVDAERRTVKVEPGVTLGALDAATQAHGLATPLGINSTTGVAGLTLGGGFGWLSRRLGLTIDNLISADVVIADGTMLHTSPVEEPDLFWAIRGGGGNFGVVTSFEFQLFPIGPQVLAGLVVHPLDAAHDVLRHHQEFFRNAPEEISCWFVMRQAPPLPFLPAEWHGREILALAMCYSGSDLAEGERIAKPLRTHGKPIGEHVGPVPYTQWQTVLDPLLAPGMRNYWKSHDFREIPDGLVSVLVEHAKQIPDPQTEIAVAQLGGAVSRIAPEATAYTHRDGQYVMNVHGRWADPAKDDACIAWARHLYEAASPFATGGVYVNFLTQEEGSRLPAAYGSNYGRLRALKKRYDPGNLFRVNQNIQ